MKIHCIAILNRHDNPIYLRSFDEQQEDVKYHYLAHTSCDIIEERLAQSKSNELFLGLLQTVGEMVVHGYVMNTGHKIILVSSVSAESAAIRNSRVKEICQSVHAAYVALVCNPFYENNQDEKLTGSKFDLVIDKLQ